MSLENSLVKRREESRGRLEGFFIKFQALFYGLKMALSWRDENGNKDD